MWTNELHAIEQHLIEAKQAAISAGEEELIKVLQAIQAKTNSLIGVLQNKGA